MPFFLNLSHFSWKEGWICFLIMYETWPIFWLFVAVFEKVCSLVWHRIRWEVPKILQNLTFEELESRRVNHNPCCLRKFLQTCVCQVPYCCGLFLLARMISPLLSPPFLSGSKTKVAVFKWHILGTLVSHSDYLNIFLRSFVSI